MKLLAVLGMGVFSLSNVFAEKFEPAKLLNVFEPQFTTIVQYNDNIYTTESETVSSFIYYLRPSISFLVENDNDRYGGEYILTASIYDNDQNSINDDDMTDHQFSLFVLHEFTAKHRAEFNFEYDILHEQRGSGLTESDPRQIDSPLDFDQLNGRFHYRFGGQNAKVRIGMGLSYYEKQYKAYTSQTKYNDLDQLTFSADTDYQIGDVSYLTLDVLTTSINYQHRRENTLLKNNQDTRALIGLTWRGSHVINGRARFGYQYKTFDEIDNADFNGSTIDLRINWSPVDRAIYSLDLSRAAEDTDTVGDYVNNIRAVVGWRNKWNNKIDSNIEYEYINKDFIGVDRDDNINNINVSLIYGFSRWLSLSAGYEYLVSNSNVNYIEYDQNIFTLSLKVAL